MNNGEDWWNTDNSTTADLFRHPMDDVRNSRHSLDATYCRPSRLYPCSHSCLMFASNGSMKVTQSSPLSKNTGKMTLPVNQGQGWWGVDSSEERLLRGVHQCGTPPRRVHLSRTRSSGMFKFTDASKFSQNSHSDCLFRQMIFNIRLVHFHSMKRRQELRKCYQKRSK